MVFVHYNLHLLQHKSKENKEGESKKWDIGVEVGDFEASTARLTLDDFEEFDGNTIVAAAPDPIGLSSPNAGEEEEDED